MLKADKAKLIPHLDYLEREIQFLSEYKEDVDWKVYQSVREKRLEIEREAFSEMAKIRNTLAHRYLDLRWQDIQRFIQIAEKLCPAFIKYLKIETSI